MQKMITITFANGECKEYSAGITLLEISRDAAKYYTTPIVGAIVNNDLKDLSTCVNLDTEVDFLDLHSEAGMKIYQRSLVFVLIAATQQLFPKGELTVEHSLNKGLYCELHKDGELSEQDVASLEKTMRDLIAQNLSITKKSILVTEAIALLESSGQYEKVKLLKQLNRNKVSIYYCGDYFNYLYGVMVPNIGILGYFTLHYREPGLVLSFPLKENPDELPDYIDQPKIAAVLKRAEDVGKILRCPYVAELNESVEQKKIGEIVRIAEALHEKKIAYIADYVYAHKNKVRVILVAGPSSSGKTTFAQRLSIQLKGNGLRPVPISLDDYFLERSKTPRDDRGDYDFEAIEAIDLDLFNEHLLLLLQGKKVKIPSYNFITGQREYRGHMIALESDQPLIIEGIHGLNERLTRSIAREQKLKIYISALTQLSIDNHNRIPTTDARLIRRIVRDSQFRAHDAERTLKIWHSVRRGEERNIFPFQEEADIMFNSALIYELGVLRKHAEPLLEKILPISNVYLEAKRLLEFLSYFRSIPDDEVPVNSILREFVGNSCFFD